MKKNKSKEIINENEREFLKIDPIKLKNNYLVKKLLLIKIKNYMIKIILLLLIFLNYYLYYLSLEKCLKGFDVCGQKSKWILKKLTQAVISYFITSLLFELMILNKISIYHLFHIIVVFSYFYN